MRKHFEVCCVKQLLVIYLVQDNNWVSVGAEEIEQWTLALYASGFPYNNGKNRRKLRRADTTCVSGVNMNTAHLYLVQARVPLFGHHTSGAGILPVAADLAKHAADDSGPKAAQPVTETALLEGSCRR